MGEKDELVPKIDGKTMAIAEKLQPVISAIAKAMARAMPVIIKAAADAYALYQKVEPFIPANAAQVVYGLVLCFFGGHYVVLIAAVEAFKLSGWDTTWENLKIVAAEVKLAIEASAADDQVDADGDGRADVAELKAKQIVIRKALLVMRTINPERLYVAVGCLYTAWMGVLATLMIKFAKVITLALSIGNIMRPGVKKTAGPVLRALVPQPYHKWIDVGINVACKAVAASIAWFIQTVISSVQSAIRGGLMVSRGTMRILSERGIIKINPDETAIDEWCGWAIAAVGIYMQLKSGFSLPFPLNWLLLPLDVVEAYLKARVVGVLPAATGAAAP